MRKVILTLIICSITAVVSSEEFTHSDESMQCKNKYTVNNCEMKNGK